MNSQAEHVDRWLEELRVDTVPKKRRGSIGLDQVPEPVDDQSRVRLVRFEQPLQRLAKRPHHRSVVGLVQVGRREAAREQQPIALGDRQVEALGEMDQQLAARARAAGLDEAEVLGREARVERELELAEPAAATPEPDQLADGLRLPFRRNAHRRNASRDPDPPPLPLG